MRSKFIALGAVLVGTTLAGVALANPGDDNYASGKATITVTPTADLAATATVMVSGGGYRPGTALTVWECSPNRADGGRSEFRVCDWGGAVEVTTGADGTYGPVALNVASTFTGSGYSGGELQSRTVSCLPQNACRVVAALRGSGPNWIAWQTLSFTE